MRSVILLSLFASLLFSSSAWSKWQLINEKSQLNFMSIKKNTVGEVHTFNQLSGEINKKGEVNFAIDLTSVNTNIAIRDQRMETFLFETDKYTAASFSTKLNVDALAKLTKGSMMAMTLNGVIELHGQAQSNQVNVNVVKLQTGDLLVTSAEPLLINAEQFALTQGILKLQELAGLPSISSVVPVTFSLYFAH